MKRKLHRHIPVLTASLILIFMLSVYMISLMNVLQASARVINYSGILRGGTQRLIKKELQGIEDDIGVKDIDKILFRLKPESIKASMGVLNDPAYETGLRAVRERWVQMKALIYDFRGSSKDFHKKLYEESEAHYLAADQTVSAAEAYTTKLAQKLHYLEIALLILMFISLMALYFIIRDEMLKNRTLKGYAFTDPATGLPNRRSCEKRLYEIDKHKESDICLFMFDLNDLKSVNDRLGHAAGDRLLSSFARVLLLSAEENIFVCRIGGDEFIGIGKDMSPKDIILFINRISEETAKMNQTLKGENIFISTAVGYARSKDYPELSAPELMARADQEMFSNKLFMKRSV